MMQTPARVKPDTIRTAVIAAAIGGLTLWAYWGVLDAPFHFDDSLFLESPQVTAPGDPSHLIRPAQTRQLTYLTFYLNYRFGGASPKGYHLVNLLVHLCNAALMCLFVRLLLRRTSDMGEPAVRRLLPLAAAGIFALHPVQSEPVNYAYQRGVLLAAFFSLLALSIYFWAGSVPKRPIYRFLVVICWLLAAASKESAWILPLVILGFLWAHAQNLHSFRLSLMRLRWFVSTIMILMLSGLGWVYYNQRIGADRTIGNLLSGDSLRYLVSQVQAFATYSRLLLWPAGLSIDHDFHVAPFFSVYGILCLLLLLGAITLIGAVRGSKPTLSFLGLSFFLLLVPTSSILPSSDLLFEHRLYLPMIASSILMGWSIIFLSCALVNRWKEHQAFCLGVLGAVFISYAMLSRERTYVWGDNIRLWTDAVTKAPDKARAHYNLGVSCLHVDPERARKEFLRVNDLSPHHAAALYNLGWIDQSLGCYEGARKNYLESLEADPRNWRAYQNLGNLDVLQGRLKDAVTEYRETIRLSPDYWPAYLSLAALQIQQGNPQDALPTLQKLKELRPDLLEGWYMNARAFLDNGRFPEAEAELRALEARDPAGTNKSRIEELRLRIASERGKR